MRIFVPFELNDLDCDEISPRLVHAVTQKLVRIFPNEDQEGLEYVATLTAADDSLRKLDLNGKSGFRRIVGVAEAPNEILQLPSPEEEIPATGIYLNRPLQIKKFESFLVDEPGSEGLVRQALAGNEQAFIRTEDIELLWYERNERKILFMQMLQENENRTGTVLP